MCVRGGGREILLKTLFSLSLIGFLIPFSKRSFENANLSLLDSRQCEKKKVLILTQVRKMEGMELDNVEPQSLEGRVA